MPTAYAYEPFSDPRDGDLWLSPSANYNNPVKGNYAFATLLHEIGHTMGLKHGHEVDQCGNGAVFPVLPAQYDAMEYSIMTYRSYGGASTNFYANESNGYAQSLMMADIAAIQNMYGANFNTCKPDVWKFRQ